MGGRPWKIHHCNMRSFCMLLQQSSGPSANEGIFINHRSTSDSLLVSPVCLSRASVDGLICVLALLLPLFDKHIVWMSKVSVSIVLEVAKSFKLWWWIGVQGGGCFSFFFFNRESFSFEHIMSQILCLCCSIGRLL